MKTKKLTQMALLITVALIIFVVELQIPNPIPLPGAKLGLSNIVTVYAVYRYRAKEVALILFVRIFLASFFSGNMVAMLYSLAGGTLCLLGMLAVYRFIPNNHLWACSLLGAILHNIGQIMVAVFITATWSILVYLPLLLVSGCFAGIFTGLSAQFLLEKIPENIQFF